MVNVYFPHDSIYSSVANAVLTLPTFPWHFPFQYMPTWFPADSTCDLLPERFLLAADTCSACVQAGRKYQRINAVWEKSFKTMTDGSWWVNTPVSLPLVHDNFLEAFSAPLGTQGVIHRPVTLMLQLHRSELEVQILRTHPKTTESESLQMGTKNICLNGWYLYTLKLERHYSSGVPQKGEVAYNSNLLDNKPFISFLPFLSHFPTSLPVFIEITPPKNYMHLNVAFSFAL